MNEYAAPDRQKPPTHSPFFAYISRMRLIRRWSLMQNSQPENIQEHSHRTAVLAHLLATIRNVKFGGDANPERAAFLALLHDAGEALTGDLPTPVKYFDPEMRERYANIEKAAHRRLLEFLPPEFRAAYEPAFFPGDVDGESWDLVRAADKLCAWLKCVEERRGGNREFLLAEQAIKAQLDGLAMPEIGYFFERFAPGFSLTLDELGALTPERS
ncbi:MAG: 5'-deoxynucleotidase [Planctomycetota bacterium]|jgi:5'-deoxynucleotidase|nr:5'-deoxynucleotidase [Planctomycetota bacterium]